MRGDPGAGRRRALAPARRRSRRRARSPGRISPTTRRRNDASARSTGAPRVVASDRLHVLIAGLDRGCGAGRARAGRRRQDRAPLRCDRHSGCRGQHVQADRRGADRPDRGARAPVAARCSTTLLDARADLAEVRGDLQALLTDPAAARRAPAVTARARGLACRPGGRHPRRHDAGGERLPRVALRARDRRRHLVAR